ncbi:MAG TPA: nucleoside monophosphate kinase [Planctomycetota bacterium]|nr:nucleoside monophosphate kinase [Planctomycetota bacterium]
MAELIRAALLLGPTGSGKSPVGAWLERRGAFRHFDFGAELRAAAAGQRGLPQDDAAFVRRLLATHALLPDERFPIAEALLDAFLRRAGFDPECDVLVLNGLPRHAGQARALAQRVRVEHVIVLECDAEAAQARVARRRRGEGMDHAGRDDDAAEAVARKLALYASETEPLAAYYAAQPGVSLTRLRVGTDTREEDLAERVAAAWAGAL